MIQNRANQPKTKDRTESGPVWVVGPGVRFGLVDKRPDSVGWSTSPVKDRTRLVNVSSLEYWLTVFDGPVLFCLDSVRSGLLQSRLQVGGVDYTHSLQSARV